MVQEVHQTSEILTPPPAELPEQDSRAAYARNTAVMTVGTTLSRLTGYVRIAAQTAALGVTIGSLGDTYTRANTTPNIVYELILGGILTSVFVPVFVEWHQKHGKDAAWDVGRRMLTLALVVLSVVAIVGMIFAPQIMEPVPVVLGRARPSATDRTGRVPPAVVHAPDRLLRDRGDRRWPADGRAALRAPDVHPDPEQPGRDRRVPGLRARRWAVRRRR